MTQYFPVMFGILMVLVVAWFVLILSIFSILKTNHASVFESLKSPSLFSNKDPKSMLLFAGFLLRRNYRGLDDARLVRLCNVTLVVGAVYFVLFSTMFASVVLSSI